MPTITSDVLISWLRTIIPMGWGLLVSWLLSNVGWLPDLLDSLNIDPNDPKVVAGVVFLVMTAWYSVWRWVQKKKFSWMPDVVIGLALGSSADPQYYRAQHAAGSVEVTDTADGGDTIAQG